MTNNTDPVRALIGEMTEYLDQQVDPELDVIAKWRDRLEAARASAPPSAPVGDDPIDASDNAEYIEHCADRLERLGLRVTAGALRVIAHEHRALLAERDALAAALEAALEDAERYRWLRDPCSGAERVIFYCRGDYRKGLMSSSMLDAAIDQARGKENGNG